VTVRAVHYEDMIHGFFWMAGAVDRGRDLIAEVGEDLRRQLSA
jgi:hypothetical protein